ncbi:MAG TPA: carboxypeptidase regulatory-like domain-containing protein [Kofleriaceae bacterium]|nr:carboxypeptidase regulatory-like domain-containing protein [Kofleriaceae bacterium]
MKRRVAGVVGLVALLIAGGIAYRRCAGGAPGGGAPGTAAERAGGGSAGSSATANRKPRVDPAKLVRGSIAGTVTDEAKAPVPKARVCAGGVSSELPDELLRDPSCVTADEQGRYRIPNLLPARYTASASAKPFRPGAHHPGGDRRKAAFPLAAGEHRTGIDITLRKGGVEITGTVADLTGGPIAGAKVWASASFGRRARAAVHGEADEQGKFSLWVEPGIVSISASAEGYTEAEEWGRAPGTFELLLTPESSLAGTVVDAETSAPVAGARVSLSTTNDWLWDDEQDGAQTDEQGRFRISRVAPGRHVVIARSERGYGRTEGSTLVGLGQHVDGVTVKLFPAARVEGKIVIATTQAACEDGSASLSDPAKPGRAVTTRRGEDGMVWANGVRPGTYDVTVRCDGYRERERYEPVAVAGKDVTGLVWEVEPGATVRGRVLTKSGEPVDGAWVSARKVGGASREKRSFDSDTSEAEGRYEIVGLRPGSYELEVDSPRGVTPEGSFKVDIAAGATVERDLVLEDGGTIRGTIVDAEGRPVAAVEASARAASGQFTWNPGGLPKSDPAGAFVIEGVRPGDYRVVAQRSLFDPLRRPGTTDDTRQGERVTVRAGQTSVVRLVIEAPAGAIRGTVVDAAGRPVGDAFVSAARESDAAGARASSVASTRWSWDEKPALTGVDGAFTVGKLTPGKYTLRAYRKGGGEAVAEHVAVGETARLQITTTGSIEGTVRRAGQGPPEELTVTVREPKTAFTRREQLYRTAGRYAVRDLPKGHFLIQVEAEGGQKQVEVDLAEGEAKTGVDVELEGLIDVTGRVVEHGTGKPAPGLTMSAQLAKGGAGAMIMRPGTGADQEHVTDESGRFKIKRAPAGAIVLRGFPKDFANSDYGFLQTVRTVDAQHPDVGDITVIKRRIKRNEPAGELGVNFAQQPPDTPPDQREFKVSYIDPAGPAAKTELKVGDLLVSVDGVDVTGANASNAWMLMRAPPGTKLVLGLKRGAQVTIVLAAP